MTLRHSRNRNVYSGSADEKVGYRRKAAISVMVMLVLLLLSGMMAAQVRRVLSDRRQSRQEVFHLQAEHLAQAGMIKAAAAWNTLGEYQGEDWNLPAGIIHQTNSAAVEIRISGDGECRVIARYPANYEVPFQVTRTQRFLK